MLSKKCEKNQSFGKFFSLAFFCGKTYLFLRKLENFSNRDFVSLTRYPEKYNDEIKKKEEKGKNEKEGSVVVFVHMLVFSQKTVDPFSYKKKTYIFRFLLFNLFVFPFNRNKENH